jgi:hypothetical protein
VHIANAFRLGFGHAHSFVGYFPSGSRYKQSVVSAQDFESYMLARSLHLGIGLLSFYLRLIDAGLRLTLIE